MSIIDKYHRNTLIASFIVHKFNNDKSLHVLKKDVSSPCCFKES